MPNAPRENPLVKLIDERIERKRDKTRGLILPAGSGTFFREVSLNPFEPAITTTVNVQMSGSRAQADRHSNLPAILENVPIAVNNRSFAYARSAQIPVELSKSKTGKVEITGLSKRGPAVMARRIEVSIISGNIIPDSETYIGVSVWPVEYGDFPAAGGYGVVPYGAMAMYDGAGNFIRIIGG